MDAIAAPSNSTTATANSPKKDKSTTNSAQINADKMETCVSSELEKEAKNNEAAATTIISSSKTLKRCLSVPIIRNVPTAASNLSTSTRGRLTSSITTRSAAAAATRAATTTNADTLLETPKKEQQANNNNNNAAPAFLNTIHIGIPRSNPSSREVSPAPMFNIFAPRARRYSASYSPMGGNAAAGVNSGNAALSANGTPLCLTPRVSQLRQEECLDMNSREVNHEREVHTQMQMSQSWEDLTLVAENWSCKSDEFSNPLQVVLPPTTGSSGCSSPSPTSTRAGLRLPYGLSPSPTRRTFATRRSMSPIAMRPSQLGAVKRKFEMEECNNGAQGNWNVYSPPPLKKIFTESRGSSPSSVCPSPDSGTYDGRMTPKLFISKLCTSNANSNISTSSSSCSSTASSVSSGSAGCGGGGGSFSEPMICSSSSVDEGISGSESEEKMSMPSHAGGGGAGGLVVQSSTIDMQDDTALMDEKSETSSIGGCSSISIESSSWDGNNARTPANFLSQLATTTATDELPIVSSSSSSNSGGPGGINAGTAAGLSHKNFYINKPVGVSGTRKYIVNHDNKPNSSSSSNSINCNNNNSSSQVSTPDLMTGDISSNTGGGVAIDHITGNAIIAANVI